MGDVARGAAHRRPLSRAAGRGLRRGGGRRSPPARLGVLAPRAPARARRARRGPTRTRSGRRRAASPNLQGWLLGIPFWPLRALLGNIWAYNLVVLLSIVAAGALTCWWLRALGLARGAALVGGLVFALAPYRLGQSTGHLLGLIAFLLPAVLLALERRRFVWAAIALTAIPLCGQIHLAMGAVVLALGYTWARVPRADWWKAGAGAVVASVAAVTVQQVVVAGSIASGGRSFGQVRHYSAELSDLFTRGVGAGIEEYVFLGWLTPILALVGLWAIRRRRGLAVFLGLAAVVPCVLALGASLPLYEPLWKALPPLRFARVPERLMPIACLAIAALVAHAVAFVLNRHKVARAPAGRGDGRRCGGPRAARASTCGCRCSAPSPPTRPNAAYAAIRGDGRLLELPVFRPDIHFGSVAMAYARQSPRERPLGYSTTAPPAADRLARELAAALVRPRHDPGRARGPLRRRAPRPLRAERLLRRRLRRAGGGGAAPGRLAAARPRRRDLELGARPRALAGRVRSGDDGAAETDYLEAVLNANVYDVAIETPLQEAPLLSQRLGNRLLLKREDLQPVFSFKLRGAYNKMSRLLGGRAAARRRRRVGRQPRAGRRARGAAARHRGDDRDAGDDAADQDRLGRRARRDRRARGRLVRRRLRRGDAHRAAPEARVRPPLRRPRRDRRPGHDRDGDPARSSASRSTRSSSPSAAAG